MVPCTPLQQRDLIVEECNSSMSPYHYEIITLPNNVQKLYGCGKRFWDCYWVFLNNLIVRHRDHRIMGMSITGHPIVNRNFQYTYCHLKKNHIARKNPAFAQNIVVFATPDVCQILTIDPKCRNIINTLDVIVQPTPVEDLINVVNGTHICFLLCICTWSKNTKFYNRIAFIQYFCGHMYFAHFRYSKNYVQLMVNTISLRRSV